MRTLKYGGDIQIGDFIGIADGNHLSFGWFCGTGKSGTLQYYWYGTPEQKYKQYLEWENPKNKKMQWLNKLYQKGFTTKCLWKSYINAVHSTRVLKINSPEDIFTTKEDREQYEKSKEILIKLKFVKQ